MDVWLEVKQSDYMKKCPVNIKPVFTRANVRSTKLNFPIFSSFYSKLEKWMFLPKKLSTPKKYY